MIATTLDILVTDRVHPAHQLLLLEATAEFERKRVSYFTQGKFPVYMDTRIPESDVARRFFKEGSPLLWGYAPFWMASLFDEVWFYLLAIGAIIIPLLGFVPSYRKTHAVLSIESCYDELRNIENELTQIKGAANLAMLICSNRSTVSPTRHAAYGCPPVTVMPIMICGRRFISSAKIF